MILNYDLSKNLKSRLKGKVRICTAFMVAMLITGNVAMASVLGITNNGIVTEDISISTNNGIAIDASGVGTNNGISVTGGVVSLGGTTNHEGSGYSLPVDASGYIFNTNVNVNDKDTTFTGDILDPDTGESSSYTLIEASNFSNGIHQEGTINILENTGGLSEGEIFVGLNLGTSGSLYNCCGHFNVASLNGADVIGIYHSGYSVGSYGDDDYHNFNYNTMNISTDGHGIGYYFSDGGSFTNCGTINADTALVMTSDTNNNTLTNSGTMNGDVLMDTSGTNTVTVSGGTINGDITFSGGGSNYLTYSNVGVSGTGDINGDDSGYNQITTAGGYSIEKNIYNFNVLKVSGSGAAALAEGYEVSMNPQESYTPGSGTSTGLTVDGTLTLNTELSGSNILVPKIETYGGDITVSDTGKIRFYVTGDGTESSYDVVFGGTLSTVNVASEGKIVASDGTLEYEDELFSETLGWNVTNIIEGDTQTVLTLSTKDVYDELREENQGSSEYDRYEKMINILDDEQDGLGIHEELSNVSMDDAEKVARELSGDIYGDLSDNHINVQKMFTRNIGSMMNSPLALNSKDDNHFAAMLETATAELSSDMAVFNPYYGDLSGKGEYIQHFDFLGSKGDFDKEGSKYDTDSYGFVGITEKIQSQNMSLGVSYGYFDTKNDYDDGSDSESETFHLGLLQRLYFKKDYMLVSHLGAEYSKNNVDREITTLGMEANSDYDSYSVGIGTELSKKIELNEKVSFIPSIGANYSRIIRESFKESGSIGDAALDVERQELDSVTTTLGARFDVELTKKIIWNIGGSWEHEYADLNEDQEASFKGDADSETFKIRGANFDENAYTLSTGFIYNANESVSYRILYSFTKQDDLDENNIDLGVSWKF